jgi:hypothetical protein
VRVTVIFYNHKIFINKLITLKPKIVIECINSTDIIDVIWRGGNEKFNSDGTVNGKVGPNWEFLYCFSHVFRVFMNVFYKYNEILINENNLLLNEKHAVSLIISKVKQTAQFCLNHHNEYHLILHPISTELIKGATQPIELIQQFSNKPYVTSLFNSFNNYFKKMIY